MDIDENSWVMRLSRNFPAREDGRMSWCLPMDVGDPLTKRRGKIGPPPRKFADTVDAAQRVSHP